jgi:hypothetical protein
MFQNPTKFNPKVNSDVPKSKFNPKVTIVQNCNEKPTVHVSKISIESNWDICKKMSQLDENQLDAKQQSLPP